MKLISNLTQSVTRVASITMLKLRQSKPEIALGGSIIFSAAAVGFAIWGTKKIQDEGVIEETHEMLTVLDEDPESTKRDYIQVWTIQGGKIAKAYLPSFACWSASVACSIVTHRELKKRVQDAVALAMAYQKAYEELNNRHPEIIQKSTNQAANKLQSGDVDGEEMIEAVDERDPRLYHFNRQTAFGMWENNPYYIRDKLERTQKTAYTYFKAHGYIMLKDILEMLGMAEEIIDEVPLSLGWLDDGNGNNTIDFGLSEYLYPLMDIDDALVVKDVILRFNCDWWIYDKERPMSGALKSRR